MNREKHLKAISIVGSGKRYKRYGLILLCSGPDCAGAEMFADGINVASVMTATDAHVKEYEGCTGLRDAEKSDPHCVYPDGMCTCGEPEGHKS